MAEGEKPKLDIPWGTIASLIALLAGIIVQYRPLASERPAAPGEKTVEVVAEQDVDARLWQDPLAVVGKEKQAHDAKRETGNASLEIIAREARYAQRHGMESLANTIADRVVAANPDRILLLAVMIDSGPYIEQQESRLRSRQAVLQALSEGNFVPADGEHIAFVTAPWPPSITFRAEPESEILLPWEECQIAGREVLGVYPQNTRNVFVLWLPAANFDRVPLTKFAGLTASLTEKIPDGLRTNVDIRLIGPLNSKGLQDMIQEVRDWKGEGILSGLDTIEKQRQADLARKVLQRTWIVSPRATMENEALLDFPQTLWKRGVPASHTESSEESVRPPLRPISPHVEKEIENAIGGGFRFLRTIATDDVVLGEMVKELSLRGINMRRASNDRIVLLTEWDSPYGRSLVTTFTALASKQSDSDLSYSDLIQKPEGWKPSFEIRSYHYLRGIDGRVPGTQGKSADEEDKQKSQETLQPGVWILQQRPEEATEGMDQSDYLRRLARELKEDEPLLQGRYKWRTRAIGLLGADIYDKLMILRVLRPEFPDAIFFTNNFDAHFERRADWRDVRNLVVVSPFGSTLPIWQSRTAPFRDSAQTAMYEGTLVSTGKIDEKTAIKFTKHPKIFEIGRYGAWDLSRSWYLSDRQLVSSPYKTWFRDLLADSTVRWHLAFAAIALLAVIPWIGLGGGRTLPGGGGLRRRLERLAASTPFWLACGVPIIIFSVAWYSQHGRAVNEPLAFLFGISIWPTEMLRLIAVFLAIHFMIKASLSLKWNERGIAALFHLPTFERTRIGWWEGFKRQEYSNPLERQFRAEDAWLAYLKRNCFWPRFIRIWMSVSIYFVFAFTVSALFVPASVPARGLTAFMFNNSVTSVVALSVMILSFYVFDALQLTSNLIRLFIRGAAAWPAVLFRSDRSEGRLKETELSWYFDVLFVAETTEAVAPLIWYPLIVFILIFVARWSYFDNWRWPTSQLLLFAFMPLWASFGSAIFLRSAAERLRETAISNLQLSRASTDLSGVRNRTLNGLIAEISTIKKGAFAPLHEQPFIRAILFPGGSLGLLAVAQRLLEIYGHL